MTVRKRRSLGSHQSFPALARALDARDRLDSRQSGDMVIVVVVEAEKPWLWWLDVLVAEFTPNVLGHLWSVYGVRLADWLDSRPVQSADTMCVSCMFS